MNKERQVEVLAYAKVCFDKCTNPFASIHLIKKQISADECRDLSHQIAEIIEDFLELNWSNFKDIAQVIKEAEKEFLETQK